MFSDQTDSLSFKTVIILHLSGVHTAQYAIDLYREVGRTEQPWVSVIFLDMCGSWLNPSCIFTKFQKRQHTSLRFNDPHIYE